MNYIERNLTSRFFKLFEHFPVVVIIGARQVGKTTFVKEILRDKADYVVFDPTRDVENARTDPELFLNNHKKPLILDEIQYVPEIISVIKRKIDEDKHPGQYILTGSQQWGVLKEMAESLAGRAVILQMHGFDLSEINDLDNRSNWLEQLIKEPDLFFKSHLKSFHLKQPFTEILYRGNLPFAQSIPLNILNDFHDSYIRTYIERDVRLLADVSDYQLFGRFYRLAAALSAQEINYSQLGRDIGITPQTSKRWLDILKSTFQWIDIKAFTHNPIKKLSLKPKGYLIDSGLICHSLFLSQPNSILSHPLMGAIFESFVVSEIIKKISFMDFRPNIYHWRLHSGAEVDLILEFNNCLLPIEIKSKSLPTRKDTLGIKSFMEYYKKSNILPGVVISLADQIYPIDENIYTMPVNLMIKDG